MKIYFQYLAYLFSEHIKEYRLFKSNAPFRAYVKKVASAEKLKRVARFETMKAYGNTLEGITAKDDAYILANPEKFPYSRLINKYQE